MNSDIPGFDDVVVVGGKLVEFDANLVGGVRVDSKAIAVLGVLIEHAPHPVPISEITEQVWPRQDVGDNVVHQAIAHIRKSLGDNAHAPAYIETVPKKGYRVVAEVQRQEKPHKGPKALQRKSPIPVGETRRTFLFAAFGTLCVTAGGVSYFVWKKDTFAESTKILPLPLQHIGLLAHAGPARRAYEEVNNELSRLRVLVGARITIAQLHEEQLPHLVKRLRATHLLEATCQVEADQDIRFQMRLLAAKTELPVWQGRYAIDQQQPRDPEFWHATGQKVVAATRKSRRPQI